MSFLQKRTLKGVFFIYCWLISHIACEINLEDFSNKCSIPDSICRLEIVESLPEVEDDTKLNTSEAWMTLFSEAKNEIQIASYYMFQLDNKYNPEQNVTKPHVGYEIYNSLVEAKLKRNVTIKIATTAESSHYKFKNGDLKKLTEDNIAEVRQLNFSRLIGAEGGILHTKLIVVDRKNIYIGSANFGVRSVTTVKQIGILGRNCSCLGEDLGRIFDIYWELGKENATIPKDGWPTSFGTAFNKNHPMKIRSEENNYDVYVSSAPPEFCPSGRTADLDALLNVIDTAEKFIHISVTDYYPLHLYKERIMYWPVIEDSLKRAAIDRQVNVKLLVAQWDLQYKFLPYFLKSLESLSGSMPGVDIQTKLYVGRSVDYNGTLIHHKYIITEKLLYLGTSNFVADYFDQTGSVGITMKRSEGKVNKVNDILSQINEIFDNNWNSPYTKTVDEYLLSL